MSKWNLALISALLFVAYFAYNCWQDEKLAIARADKTETAFKEYKEDNNAVIKLDSKITKALENEQNNTNALRDSVNSGFVELRVKVDSIERDSSGTSVSIQKAVRLAETARQDYYDLRNGLEQNRIMILGWQEYYCTIIAPKNNTEFLCDNDSNFK